MFSEQLMTWADVQADMRRYKRNYFRSGLAFKGTTSPYLLATEMELNAHAALYLGADEPVAGVHWANLQRYLKGRFSSKQMPDFRPDLPVISFITAGVFFDADNDTMVPLASKARQHGRRKMPPLTAATTAELVALGTGYLSRQIGTNGAYHYGSFPCFDKDIATYNTLRHASSAYALLEGLELCQSLPQNSIAHTISPQKMGLAEQQAVQKQAESAIDYLIAKHLRHYAGDKTYIIEINNEIKLGANAVAILAMVKYAQMFPQSDRTLICPPKF